jgi:hypothetical protein
VLDWPLDVSAKRTKKTRTVEPSDIRPEYDFSAGVRGKYAGRFARGSNVVVLEPDVAAKFKTSRAVNQVLRKHVAPTRRRKTGGA